jgi:hypothetical protein
MEYALIHEITYIPDDKFYVFQMNASLEKIASLEMRCKVMQQIHDHHYQTRSQRPELIESERRFAELKGKFEESEATVLYLEAALWRLHVEAGLLSAEEKIYRIKASEEHETEVRAFATDYQDL